MSNDRRREGERNPDELGALWLKTGAKGEYLTGEIEGIGPVVCFPVDSRNPKAPTWRVLKSKPRDAAPSRRGEGHTAQTDDSIPF